MVQRNHENRYIYIALCTDIVGVVQVPGVLVRTVADFMPTYQYYCSLILFCTRYEESVQHTKTVYPDEREKVAVIPFEMEAFTSSHGIECAQE